MKGLSLRLGHDRTKGRIFGLAAFPNEAPPDSPCASVPKRVTKVRGDQAFEWLPLVSRVCGRSKIVEPAGCDGSRTAAL